MILQQFFSAKSKNEKCNIKNVIIPVAEGFLKIPTITEGVFMKVECYYSPEFIFTLLSNNIQKVLAMQKDYCGQSMLKFLSNTKLTSFHLLRRTKIKKQVLDEITVSYNKKYGSISENSIKTSTFRG